MKNTNIVTSYIKSQTINRTNVIFDLKKNALIFLHIPKTSGTFFDEFIIDNIMIKNSANSEWNKACRKSGTFLANCNISGEKEDWYYSLYSKKKYCLGSDHPVYSRVLECMPEMYKRLKAEDLKIFTILRDPIQRYISEWNNVRKHGNGHIQF